MLKIKHIILKKGNFPLVKSAAKDVDNKKLFRDFLSYKNPDALSFITVYSKNYCAFIPLHTFSFHISSR